MLRRARERGLRPSQDLLDLLMAVGAFVVAEIELHGIDGLGEALASPDPVTVLVAFQTLPLVFRRRAPLVVFLVVGSAVIATIHPFFSVLGSSDLAAASFISVQVALYTVNAHLPRRVGLPATVAMVLAVIAAQVFLGNGVGELGWMTFVFFVPTIAVSLFAAHLRDRRIAAAALEERALALEAERDESARRATAAERTRIARELHDVVAHSMSVMVVQAGAARRIGADDPDRAREAMRSIEVTGRDALAELRRLLGVLRRDEHEQAALAPQPGLNDLEALVAHFRDAGLSVDLAVDVDGKRLPPGADLSAYRVVQEALTNALRHANAERVGVRVRGDADGVEIEVVDDGRGPTAGDGGGTGLIGMRERVAFFGGDFRAGPHEGGGYAVWARFPLQTE